MENVELRFEKKKDRQKEEGSKMGLRRRYRRRASMVFFRRMSEPVNRRSSCKRAVDFSLFFSLSLC